LTPAVGLSSRERAALILTSRESQVLRLLARGCTYASAAASLGISPHTVESHVKNAYRKLAVHSAAAAVMRAIELRLLDPEEIT